MPKFRPPKLPKDFPPTLGEAFRQLFDDVSGLTQRPGDVSIAGSTYRPVPGEVKRVSPPLAGMGFVLPPPSADNRAEVITAIIEKPSGALRVFVSQDGPAGPSGRPSIDGDETRSYSIAGAVSFISNGADKWSESRGPTGAAGATGATGSFVGATGAANGYASRNVYNSASSPVTFTTAADIPAGNIFTLHLSGPGGGGGAGAEACGSNNPIGGGTGAGGARLPPIVLSRAALIAMLPFVATLPAGGVGATGTSRVTAGITVGADGAAALGDATISANGVVVYTAFRGGAGAGGGDNTDGSGGGGGGLYAAGTSATTVAVAGGRPLPGTAASAETAATATSTFGGGFGASAIATTQGGSSVYGGGGGGAGNSGGTGQAGGRSAYGGSGGGGGGSGNNAGTATAGGPAGAIFSIPGSAGGALANGGNGPATGSNGTPGVAGTEGYGAIGGGGGGGANGLATVSGARAVIGGNGAVGGEGGGGGGGGGAGYVNNTNASNTATGGNGGNGGSAQLILVGLPG